MIEDLGCTTSIDVINDLVALGDQFVVDVGCGDMTFSRGLAASGARVLAVDPDCAQARLNRAAAPVPNLDFVETGAEALPVADGSVDGIFFCFSLHHVPAAIYPDVFAEVARALKPSGYLCVIEPIASPLTEVMRLFHDEDREWADAQNALVELAVPAFETHTTYRYHSYIAYDSFDALVDRYSRRTFNPGYTEADIRRPEIEEAFERLGAPDYRFVTAKQMMLLQRLKTSQATS